MSAAVKDAILVLVDRIAGSVIAIHVVRLGWGDDFGFPIQ